MPDAITECTVTDQADTEAAVEDAIMQEDSARNEETELRQEEPAEITANIIKTIKLRLKKHLNSEQQTTQNAEKIQKKVLEKIILTFKCALPGVQTKRCRIISLRHLFYLVSSIRFLSDAKLLISKRKSRFVYSPSSSSSFIDSL